MRIPGLKTARRSATWLHGRLVRGAVVLGYHRVASTTEDPWELCVTVRNFAEQLEVIRSLAEPLPLSDLVARASSGSLPKRALAVTFDDGYRDFLQAALPRLQEFGIPATVFVVSGLLGSEPWWDRLAVAGRGGSTPPAWVAGSDLHAAHRHLRGLGASERGRLLAELEEAAGGSTPDLPRILTHDELARVAADPLVEIGGHTRTHPLLTSLSPTEQRTEIRECRNDLEEILGRAVSGFSFPFGGTSPALRDEVRAAGYTLACDSHNALLTRRSDPFAIPRFWAADHDGDQFARWLRRWLHD